MGIRSRRDRDYRRLVWLRKIPHALGQISQLRLGADRNLAISARHRHCHPPDGERIMDPISISDLYRRRR